MNQSKFNEIYDRILRGDTNNIKFRDICAFVEFLGFKLERQHGTSHMIFKAANIPDIINLQNSKGKAKSYQIAEIKKIIKKYKLTGGDFDD